MNQELLDIQAGLGRGRETKVKLPTFVGSWKKQGLPQSIYFCLIHYVKVFACVHHNKLWEILKQMGIPDHLTCLLRNLYAGQEAIVTTGHGTTGSKSGK